MITCCRLLISPSAAAAQSVCSPNNSIASNDHMTCKNPSAVHREATLKLLENLKKRAMPFDDNYQPKLLYTALAQTMAAVPNRAILTP